MSDAHTSSFKQTKTTTGKIEHLHFSNSNGTSMTIAANAGFVLTDLRFLGSPVLVGNTSEQDLLDADMRRSSWLVPFANRLEKGLFTWNGIKYQFPVSEETHNNSLHGFPELLDFTDIQVNFSDSECMVSACYKNAGTHKYFPFAFSVCVSYTLSERALTVKMNVTNEEKVEIPMAIGWHPYFVKNDASKLKVSNATLIEVDAQYIPTGNEVAFDKFKTLKPLEGTMLDNCFRSTDETVAISLQTDDWQLDYTQSAKSFPFFQLFTPSSADSIAIEPMMSNVNSFATKQDLPILRSGESFEGQVDLNYTKFKS